MTDNQNRCLTDLFSNVKVFWQHSHLNMWKIQKERSRADKHGVFVCFCKIWQEVELCARKQKLVSGHLTIVCLLKRVARFPFRTVGWFYLHTDVLKACHLYSASSPRARLTSSMLNFTKRTVANKNLIGVRFSPRGRRDQVSRLLLFYSFYYYHSFMNKVLSNVTTLPFLTPHSTFTLLLHHFLLPSVVYF